MQISFLIMAIVDCDDRSDEHREFCMNYTCPDHKTKCGDGTCIHKMIQCDNTLDCLEGGDEHDEVCLHPQYKLGKLKAELKPYQKSYRNW
ncbi:hypothetical protein PV327_006373 [Microctonus hyperodae]|uniref:Uncharacterized protein n=1 Tax=Microctonus hyperodae TaxID=165561 RepID=A0AA39F453_MICHY|nr:hypothetical protein PV327_006373 [Microctonus hyperodae]